MKGTIFENKYALCWNTQIVTLMREAILYCLPKTKDLSLPIRVITKSYRLSTVIIKEIFGKFSLGTALLTK